MDFVKVTEKVTVQIPSLLPKKQKGSYSSAYAIRHCF